MAKYYGESQGYSRADLSAYEQSWKRYHRNVKTAEKAVERARAAHNAYLGRTGTVNQSLYKKWMRAEDKLRTAHAAKTLPFPEKRSNPTPAGRATTMRRNSGLTKTQKREATRKRAVERRVASALSKYLKQVNPSGKKLAGAKVEKLKGGVLKITPIKANAGKRQFSIAGHQVTRDEMAAMKRAKRSSRRGRRSNP